MGSYRVRSFANWFSGKLRQWQFKQWKAWEWTAMEENRKVEAEYFCLALNWITSPVTVPLFQCLELLWRPPLSMVSSPTSNFYLLLANVCMVPGVSISQTMWVKGCLHSRMCYHRCVLPLCLYLPRWIQQILPQLCLHPKFGYRNVPRVSAPWLVWVQK